MRTNPLLAMTAAAIVGAAILSGCSSGSDEGGVESSQPSSTGETTQPTQTPQTTEAHTAEPGATGVSPGGVTTAVGAPAASTEDEYFQACLAAKTWMAERGGDPKAQFEPYLGDLQSSDAAGPGTFNTPWSQLAPERQSAVIVAAEAAADSLCG
jgi:hypothetical protein